MCRLVSLTQANCVESDGGIYETRIIDFANIADIVFNTTPMDPNYGEITDVVTVGTGEVFSYVFDDDDTAFYNQTGVRQNKKHTVTQQAFFKFAGIDSAKVSFANGIKGCCELFAFHFANSGSIFAQGIDFDEATDTWLKSKQRAKATVNILTDTGANEDRVEVFINSVGRCFSPLTTMTPTEIDAIDNT